MTAPVNAISSLAAGGPVNTAPEPEAIPTARATGGSAIKRELWRYARG